MAEKKAKKTTKNESAANSTFAVIMTGGKQYVVREGDFLNIEKIKGEYKVGDKIVFDKVLMVDDGENATIGTPFIKEAKVEGKIAEIGKAPKVTVVKYKAKSRYHKVRGHRQPFFKIEVMALK